MRKYKLILNTPVESFSDSKLTFAEYIFNASNKSEADMIAEELRDISSKSGVIPYCLVGYLTSVIDFVGFDDKHIIQTSKLIFYSNLENGERVNHLECVFYNYPSIGPSLINELMNVCLNMICKMKVSLMHIVL